MLKKRIRWALYSLLPLAFILLPFTTGNFLRPFKTVTLEPKQVGIATLNYYDHTRNRPLVTEIWYPSDPNSPGRSAAGIWVRCDEARDAPMSTKKASYPLIMMSHGSNGDRYNISWLAETLAANGYIVAAMDHYGNTWNNKIPSCYVQAWERPQDISFVLDQLLTEPLFKDKIDQSKIGFAGYSLGGATGMWIAGAQLSSLNADVIKKHSLQDVQHIPAEVLDSIDFQRANLSYRDNRIQAVMVMAPALGWAFTEESLNQIAIPVLIVAPETDQIVPTEKNAKIFAEKIKRATLTILPGDANHYVFLSRATQLGKRFIDRKYCEDPTSINRDAIHKDIAKKSVLFFDKHLQ